MCRGCAGHTCGGHRPTLDVSPHFHLVTKTVAFGIKINDSQGLEMELRGLLLLSHTRSVRVAVMSIGVAYHHTHMHTCIYTKQF